MQNMDFVTIGFKVGMFFVPFLFALCFHEFAHGMVAKWLGDNTAERAGRLTLNPFVHADPLGTWFLPLLALVFGSPLFFGWAKPVPVDGRNLRRPKQDMFWVALAGPASNILLALVSAILLGVLFAFNRSGGVGDAFVELLKTFILVNMFLAVFNLIPIHPLDGGKVIEPFLPYRWNRWLEVNQMALSGFLMFFLLLAGGVLALPVTWAAQELLRVSVMIAQIISG